jgi:preprotein translocase subunit SecG
LHKLTTVAAVIFMLTSIGLTLYQARQHRASLIMDQPTAQTPSEAPQAPASPEAQPPEAPAER